MHGRRTHSPSPSVKCTQVSHPDGESPLQSSPRVLAKARSFSGGADKPASLMYLFLATAASSQKNRIFPCCRQTGNSLRHIPAFEVWTPADTSTHFSRSRGPGRAIAQDYHRNVHQACAGAIPRRLRRLFPLGGRRDRSIRFSSCCRFGDAP